MLKIIRVGVQEGMVAVDQDNGEATYLPNDPVCSVLSKHIDDCHHFICDVVREV